MKFDQIILSGMSDDQTSEVNSIVLFDHKAPLSSPFVTRTVDGLGPTETNVSLAQTTQGSGLYIGRRPQLREITFNVNLNPDYTVGETPESLRESLYRMSPSSGDSSLTLRLMLNSAEVARTPVYIKRADLTPFTKDNILQLVLASPTEYFHQKDSTVLNNPEFSKTEPIFPNQGSAPTGFRVFVRFTEPMTKFHLIRSAPRDEMKVAHSFGVNDILEINTYMGERGVWLHRNNVRTSLLGALANDSVWMVLYPGNTQMTVAVEAGETHAFDWVSYSYQPKYLGV